MAPGEPREHGQHGQHGQHGDRLEPGTDAPHLMADRMGLVLAFLVPLQILATAALVAWLGGLVY